MATTLSARTPAAAAFSATAVDRGSVALTLTSPRSIGWSGGGVDLGRFLAEPDGSAAPAGVLGSDRATAGYDDASSEPLGTDDQ